MPTKVVINPRTGKPVKLYYYPSVPDKQSVWCSSCRRAMLTIVDSERRICPLCGAWVEKKREKPIE